ncbi:hypothetical protein CHS0354_026556 [Potamilus streckersoni]|uniref:Uncharacterized protein n=1 Tax=Potamilus streckersoni TaxID=2493646 RepID=A0AAE0RQ53_9BIVA|nr:hypothetical protein CHS0354_026556 [Potamilus streckersoni]
MEKMLTGPTFILTLFFAFIAEPTQAAFTYMAQCNYDATSGFKTTVVVEKASADTIYQILALSSSNALAAGCAIAQVGTTDQYTSIFTVDPTGTTFNPTQCGSAFHVVDTNSDGNKDEVDFTFLIQTTNGYVFDTDVVFKWKCTKYDHNNAIVETFTISSFTEDNLRLKTNLALEVYDSTDAQKTSGSQLTLGGSYYLKLKHTYANSKNKQVGIYVNRLVFYEGVDSTTTPNVVAIDNGCKQTVQAFGLAQNFLKDASSTLPTGGGLTTGGTDGVYVIKSGTFQTALWMKSTGISSTLKVEATIMQCLYADQAKCDDPQTNVCSAGRRRRRSAEDTGLQNLTQVSTRFTISLFGGSADQVSGNSEVKGTMDTCYQMYIFWIVILVFGILMLLCLVFAVYIFFRLRREKESRRKTEEKYGVINPSF